MITVQSQRLEIPQIHQGCDIQISNGWIEMGNVQIDQVHHFGKELRTAVIKINAQILQICEPCQSSIRSSVQMNIQMHNIFGVKIRRNGIYHLMLRRNISWAQFLCVSNFANSSGDRLGDISRIVVIKCT